MGTRRHSAKIESRPILGCIRVDAPLRHSTVFDGGRPEDMIRFTPQRPSGVSLQDDETAVRLDPLERVAVSGEGSEEIGPGFGHRFPAPDDLPLPVNEGVTRRHQKRQPGDIRPADGFVELEDSAPEVAKAHDGSPREVPEREKRWIHPGTSRA
jgi:hypothetical protein